MKFHIHTNCRLVNSTIAIAEIGDHRTESKYFVVTLQEYTGMHSLINWFIKDIFNFSCEVTCYVVWTNKCHFFIGSLYNF